MGKPKQIKTNVARKLPAGFNNVSACDVDLVAAELRGMQARLVRTRLLEMDASRRGPVNRPLDQ